MWLLECDDKDALGGGRMWLRPGSRCVLGRVKQGEVTVMVPSSRSISRTHLVINVADVNEEDGVKIHARSQITMQDCNTKHGTLVDGREIRGTSVALSGDEHSFTLGKHEHAFRLKWTPTIFSFSLTSKERKDKNVMAPLRAKVETLDIKTIATWTDSTTHVVASKRNTAIGLQALINGRYIVTSSYLDAIKEAATQPAAGDGEQALSALEVDFDANWPKPEDYLPPSGHEPVSKPPEAYNPDPRRQTLFDRWMFVFCEDVQYQNLLGPITDAQGKPEIFPLKPKITSPEELSEFIRKKRRGANVALVKFRSKNDLAWEEEFTAKIQELLGFRMVEQNEFLEIILSCETGHLRRPLEDHPTRSSRKGLISLPTQEKKAPAPKQSVPAQKQIASGAPLEASTVPLARTRGRTRRRGATPIYSFEFDLGGDFLPAPTPGPETQIPGGVTIEPYGGAMVNQPLPTPIEVEEEPQLVQLKNRGIMPVITRPSPSKRPAPVPRGPDKDEGLDVMDLLPGSRIVKRRKIEENEERVRQGDIVPPLKPQEKAPIKMEDAEEVEPRGKNKNNSKLESSFVAHAREIREREVERDEKAREQERAAMEGLDIDGLKNLALVEIVQVKPREGRPVRDAYGDESMRWKPEWNGRNNFKKFKRAGSGSNTRSLAGQRVFVELVEHKVRDYGIGDDYWIENNDESFSRRRNLQRNTQLQPDEASSSTRNTFGLVNAESRFLSRRGVQGQASSSRSAAVAAESVSRSQGTKRVANAQVEKRAGKKQKTLQILPDPESSSDDEDLKVRRRKRR